jgi:phenylpropionate dioxygenase-like ring-hydroxylating dioxygenase large terminal subunit
MLSSNYYSCEKIFNQERKNIFFKYWIFAGFTFEFTKNKIIKKNILGIDLFFTFDGKEHRVFLNQCPHRFSELVADEQCDRNLITCPYHGWSFKLNGDVNNIPFNQELYNLNPNNIGLHSLKLSVVGKFIFINFAKRPIHITKQFSKKIISEITSISIHIEEFHSVIQLRSFNWKLIIDNLRDPLHPLFVHKKTLMNSVKSGLPGIPKWIPSFLLNIKSLSFGGLDVQIRKPDYAKFFKNPWKCNDRYYNLHLFPNVHIASADNGSSFVVEFFEPISTNQTRIFISYALTKHRLGNKRLIQLLDGLKKSSNLVYEEDFALLEKIQSKMNKNFIIMPINGIYERMISRFHSVYLRILKFF